MNKRDSKNISDNKDFARVGNSVIYSDIHEKGDYIWKVGPKGNWEKVARRVDIAHILEDIDTGRITLILTYKYKGKEKSLIIPREELNRKDLLKYQKFGLGINESNINVILKHLDNQEQLISVEKVHDQLGWGIYEGRPIYKHFEAVGVSSRYSGELYIKPRGTLKKWLINVKKRVMGYVPSEVGLLFGLSAVVVGFLGMYHQVLDSLVIHKYSDSSKGKSTIDMLAVSVYGSPELRDNRLMLSWNATVNSIMSDLAKNNGLATAIDEASMAELKDFTVMLYRMAGGSDKRRMNKDLSKREAASWCTTILTNGENSLLTRSNQNTGLRVRIFECPNVVWTRDAETADKIKARVLKNHGHAGPEMAKMILKLGKKNVINIFNYWSETCLEAMAKKDQFSYRVSKKLGVLMATAEIAEKALGLKFDKKGILSFLLKCDFEASIDRDLSQKAYDYFLDQININSKRFIKKHNLSSIPSSCNEVWGSIIKRQDGVTEVAVITTVFEKLMRDGNFSDTKVLLKAWKQKNLLDCEKDRLTRSRKISGENPINVYVVLVMPEKDGSKETLA